ncbi:MAG: hypothetical protein OEU92_12640 [Alphaproteobacteria bacterium]|nr:hypothetical protein [Alphaproteobacteria bacterium]
MKHSTIIGRMRSALRQYRIDQPDSYTFAIYGPKSFYELHDSLAKALERKEELSLIAAFEKISIPSKAMTDAGEAALKSGQITLIWQALVDAIIAEYQASYACEKGALIADSSI